MVLPALWLAIAVQGQVLGAGARTQPAAPAAAPGAADGPAYQVSTFELVYLRPDRNQPPLHKNDQPGSALPVDELKVTLGQTPSGFVAPRAGVAPQTMTIADWSHPEARVFYASSIQTILETIRDYYIAQHFMGVFVAPEPTQIDADGKDLRPKGDTRLRVVITLGAVTRMRTLAYGERLDANEPVGKFFARAGQDLFDEPIVPENPTNNPLHERILAQSPVAPQTQPGAAGPHATPQTQPADDRTDLLRRDLLDDYVLRLGRHPGRRVDYSLAPSPELGGVNLDYAVTETKPWLVYAEISNTGTSSTDRIREQFGFRHYQLTNHDDILAVDYNTASFDRTHSVVASYEAPLGDSQYLRGRVFGGWNEFTAADVGQNGASFSGDSWNIGAELIANVYQHGPLFVDLVGGGRYEAIATQSTLPGFVPGSDAFFIPHAGVRVERVTAWNTFRGSATGEFQSHDINHASAERLAELGRPDVSDNWAILRWDVSESVYLEPLLAHLMGRDPLASEHPTMAHELFLDLRGQTAFGQRVIPQYESVDGGLYTVRGYPEAVVAGDDAWLATAEYRFHLPAALALEPEPRKINAKPFRLAPQQTYGPTDWDFAPRAFIDFAAVRNNPGATDSAADQTLIGTGVGFTIQYKRNATFRLDCGFPLQGIPGVVRSGDPRLHFVLTLLY
jgi:hypothetical protein